MDITEKTLLVANAPLVHASETFIHSFGWETVDFRSLVMKAVHECCQLLLTSNVQDFKFCHNHRAL